MPLTSLVVIEKQPSETLILAMDFSSWIDSDVTLTLDEVISSPDGLTIVDEVVSGQTVRMAVSEGDSGQNYRVQVTVTTSEAETLVGDGLLKVRGI